MIQTQFELNGQWSTSDFGQQFMIDLSDDTDTPLFSIGKSFLDNNIYGMEFGSGNHTILITGGVHRVEHASREAVMIAARDFAYGYNGKYDDLLIDSKVIIIPTMNPDVTTRVNAQGLNINRDAYSLETPEMAHLMKFVTDINPDIYIDFHERSGTLNKIEFINSNTFDSNSDYFIKSASESMVSDIMNSLEIDGYETDYYPSSIIGPGMTVAAASLLGALSFTPETHTSAEGGRQFRVDAQKHTLETILNWYISNKHIIENNKQAFEENMLKEGDVFTLLNGNNQYYSEANRKPITLPHGYLINNPDDFKLWEDVYSIKVEDGFVPVNQKAGRIIPHILDGESDMQVASTTKVYSDNKRVDGRYASFLYDFWKKTFIKNFLKG